MTLNEINITPLLDIAFVLLIIFIITTPLLEQGLPLELPSGEVDDVTVEPEDIQIVELHPDAVKKGYYRWDNEYLLLNDLVDRLLAFKRENPGMIVRIRAGGDSPFKYVVSLMDRLQINGITKVNWTTEPMNRGNL